MGFRVLTSCRMWPFRFALVALVYLVAIYIIHGTVSVFHLTFRPGIEAFISIIFYQLILLIVTVASSTVILYVTGSLLTTATIPLGYVILVLASPLRMLLLVNIAITLALVAVLAFVLQIRGRLGEPVLDMLYNPRISPTALAAASLSLYTSWHLIAPRGAPCEAQLLYALTSILAALVASVTSSSLPESLALGFLAGLGPFGLASTLAYATFKPLKPPVCDGLEVGNLLGFATTTSPTRALIQARTGPRGAIIACSQHSKAILSVEEPWIIWVYGLESRSLAYRIAERMGGGVALRLGAPGPGIADVEVRAREAVEKARSGGLGEVNLGGVEPLELRLAVAPTVAELASTTKTLVVDVDIPLSQDSLLKLAYEISRRHPRTIMVLQEIPWREAMIAPRGAARSSAFIITRLGDPVQAEAIARALLPRQAEGLRDLMLKGEVLVAYPGCNGNLVVLQPRV